MFEDETVDIACPQCSHRNSLLVREIEAQTESHIVCESCKVGLRIEARGFQERLNQVQTELKEIEREADKESKRQKWRSLKTDYRI